VSGHWHWWLVGVAALALVAIGLPLWLYWPQLPDPIATHWGIDFRPDGSMRRPAAFWLPAGIVVSVLLVSLIGAGRADVHGRAARLMLVVLVSGVAAAASAMIVTRNLGRATWRDAGSLTPGMLALLVAIPVVLAAAAYLIGTRGDTRRAVEPRGTAMPLAAGARAFWSGSASNRWLLAIGGPVVVLALVLFWIVPPLRVRPMLLVLPVIVFVTLEFFSRIRVTIDGRGVAIHYGHLGLWTRRVPLASIAAAHALTLDAMAHGGWGYRGGLRLIGKASIVVRSGPAIRLDLRNGQQLFVTVDDAENGALLLNALLSREPPTGAARLGEART
jgi:uncharacterized membrane protein